mmetsp:Transcript_32606/g.49136  ORF Transcript_32606/g.49136 Transcript_32606/m.49136 type:complete len:95 (+) Transcript_32606:1500-1784(+)
MNISSLRLNYPFHFPLKFYHRQESSIIANSCTSFSKIPATHWTNIIRDVSMIAYMMNCMRLGTSATQCHIFFSKNKESIWLSRQQKKIMASTLL